MPPKFNEADLDGLTEEEREGLLDETVVDEGLESAGDAGDEGDEDDQGAAGGDAGGDNRGDDAGDGDGDGEEDKGAGSDDTGSDIAGDAGADVDTGGDNAGDDAQGDEEDDEKPASWILPADINDKIKALDAERDKLAEQFDDGELNAKELRAKLKPIESELDELKERRTSAAVTRDLAIERYKTETVPTFFSEHPQYKPGTVLHTMLDTELRKLQSASKDPLNPKHLQKAHAILDKQLREALGDAAKPKPKTENQSGKGKLPKREAPLTLANVPAADISDTGDGGEFAYLDRLANQDIEAYERELGKLSDEKRDRYLAQ